MATTSDLQSIPLPENSDPVDFVGDLLAAIDAIEPRLVMTFASTGARDAAITSPSQGMVCYITGDNVFYYYQGSTWRKSTFTLLGPAGSRPSPTSVPEGTIYYGTDQNLLKAQVGSAWVILNATGDVGGSDTNSSGVTINATEKVIHEITIPANPDYALEVFVHAYASFGGGSSTDDLECFLRQGGGTGGSVKARGKDRAPSGGWGSIALSDTMTIAKGANSSTRTFTLTIVAGSGSGHTTPSNANSVGIDFVAIPKNL